MAKYFGLKNLGGLYMDGTIKVRPTKPWRIQADPASFGSKGDISNYSDLTDMSKWIIGDTPKDKANQLQWHSIKDGNKTLFICDRVILVNVSWNDLNKADYVSGKNITIDGIPYKCRLLTGGDRHRDGTISRDIDLEGGYLPNEWDKYITNEDKISEMPSPVSTDLDKDIVASDRTNSHNQFWNWIGCYTWCQETAAWSSTNRIARGSTSARNWFFYSHAQVYDFLGWRPVLELLNSAPVISGSNSNLGGKTDLFTLTYNVSDEDNDTVTVSEYVDNTLLRTYTPTLGVTNTLTVTDSVWSTLALGTHKVHIKATDGKADQVVRTHTFQKVDTLINLTSKPVETDAAATRMTVSGVFGGLDNADGTSTGAILRVYVTNNAYDETPTWEDMTEAVVGHNSHIFANKSKTADIWGVAVRIQMEKGTYNGEVSCNGFGFTFD